MFDNTLQCWGNSDFTNGVEIPIAIEFLMLDCTEICCGITKSKEIKCWGSSSNAHINELLQKPNKESDSTFEHICVGAKIICAVKTNASISCFWSNEIDAKKDVPKSKYFISSLF